MRKMFMMTTAAALITAAGVQAADPDLAELQKQLNDLSAKIAQMEKANSEKIAGLEKLAAENKIPDWVNDMKFKGDFRYRYENREVANNTTKDRQRLRLRFGAYGSVNDFTDFGIRLATGGSTASRTSSNVDLGGEGTPKSVYLDLMYVDLHPELLGGAHLIMGKMPQPWEGRTGLVWDGDLNPEGIALTYGKDFENGLGLKANAGSFVFSEKGGDDTQLWSGQLVATAKAGETKLTLGFSDFYFYNADQNNLAGIATNTSANTPFGAFNLVEAFGSAATDIAGKPVKFYGQYVVNTEAANSSEDTAYLVGVKLGKAKEKGSWELDYNWRDIGDDAVVGGLNDSDFAGETWTGGYGHVFKGKYQLAKNMSADAAYILSTDNLGKDANTLQLDLNFKF